MSCNFITISSPMPSIILRWNLFDVSFVCLFVQFSIIVVNNAQLHVRVGKLCIVFRLKWLTFSFSFIFFIVCLAVFKSEISKPSIKAINKMENKPKWHRDAAIENLHIKAYNKNHALHIMKREKRRPEKESSNCFRSVRIHFETTQQLINHNNCGFEAFS